MTNLHVAFLTQIMKVQWVGILTDLLFSAIGLLDLQEVFSSNCKKLPFTQSSVLCDDWSTMLINLEAEMAFNLLQCILSASKCTSVFPNFVEVDCASECSVDIYF